MSYNVNMTTPTKEELTEMVRIDRAKSAEIKDKVKEIDRTVHEKENKISPPSRKVVDEKLDKLYVKNVRCPYCRALIPQFTATCVQCGVTKEQIADASHQEAIKVMKGESEGKIIMTHRRPDDLNFGRFIIILVFFGWMGGHNFYVGRKIRGWIMVACFFTMVISFGFFPIGTAENMFRDAHSWRLAFGNGPWFPLDIPGIIAVVVWFYDWFCIVIFNRYKYPVRILPSETERKKNTNITESSEDDDLKISAKKHTNRQDRRREKNNLEKSN